MRLPIYPDTPATLPVLARRWLDAALPGPLPDEPHATCSACALAPPEGHVARADERYFDPRLKCCTFIPSLPNFLVGGALRGPGRARIAARIARGVGVSPLGLEPSEREALLAREGRAGFGHAHALRCPYLDEDGRCQIWAHRNAVCATWFCRHARGLVAERLWRAAKRYLSAAERAVALHCAMVVDVGDAALALLLEPSHAPRPLAAHECDERPPPGRAPLLWGRWYGQEAAFFEACAEEAAGVDGVRLHAIGGAALAAHARALQAAWALAADEGLPPRTRLGALRIHALRDGVVTVEGYSEYDLLDVPEALLAALPCFDGAAVAEALARASDERGLQITPALVRRLLDHGLLVADDEPGPGSP